MEDKQQQQQQQDESGAAGGVRRSSRLVESPLTKETRINTNKNKSPFASRRLLPTQRNRSSPVARKRSASVVSFADTSVSTMPPKKKTTAATAAANEKKKAKTSNYTELEDQLLCQAYINVSTDPTIGNGMKSKQFWSKVTTMFKHLLNDNKDDLEEWVLDADRGSESLKNRFSKKIQKDTLVFMTCYRRAYANRVSGSNDEDVVESALEEYREQYNSAFKYKHCLSELERIPKFDPKSDITEDETPAIIDTDVIELDDDDDEDEDGIAVVKTPSATKKKNNAVNNTLTAMGANSTRPIGNKQAKAMLKEEKTIHSSASGMINVNSRIADSMAVAADCKRMEQLRENIKFYQQMGMTAKVTSLMAKLDKLSEKTNEEDNEDDEDDEGVVPETVEANETRRTSSPGTESLLTGDVAPGSSNDAGDDSGTSDEAAVPI
jgi:hypothetical protein